MKDLILVLGDLKYQFDTKEDLYNEVLGKPNEDYNVLTEEQKAQRRYEKAYINVGCNDAFIGSLKDTSLENISTSPKIYTDTDDTYILSLLDLGIITILENKDSNHFTKDLDKSQLSGNYVILNLFATELLKKQKQQLMKSPIVKAKKTSKPDFELENN